MRGGDDDRKVEPEPADEDGGGGRRHHAGDQCVSPALRDAGRERALEHRAGLARVADDQDLRALRAGLVGRSAPESHGELRRQSVAGDPADPVGAEKTLSHRYLRSRKSSESRTQVDRRTERTCEVREGGD